MTDEDRKKTILIVDDEEDVRIFLQTLFENHDYDTCVAADGEIAQRLLDDCKPDLITLDLEMPNETGTRFFRALMKNKDFKNTPVIIISGLAGRDLAVSGAVAVFDKPIEPDELIAKVREIIGSTLD